MNILKRAVKFLPVAVCAVTLMWGTEADSQSTGNQWYVAPNGSSSGAGTSSSPMSLAKALSASSSPARPGDTIWLRAGTYTGAWNANLNGTASAPIIVRAYPGERVVLDGNNDAARNQAVVLNVGGSHTYYWGFEIMSSDPTRVDSAGAHDPNGIYVNTSQNVKFINLIVHDLPGQGIGLWSENTNAEVYGSLFYNVGTNHWDHAVYVQNRNGTKRIADNIIVNSASHGIHGYASTDGYLDNIVIEGNTVYESGILGGSGERNILLGGLRMAQNPVVTSNYTYYRGTSGNSNVGYSAGTANAQIKDNFWVGGNAAVRLNINAGATVTGNTFIGPLDPSDTQSRWPSNTFSSSRPTSGQQVFVRRNTYEAGRAHITIYNWARSGSVSVSLTQAGLNNGDVFEVRDAMNYYGAPVATGTYTGGSVSIPMSGLTPAAALGNGLTQPVHTAPQFGAFILVRTSGGGSTPPPGGGTGDSSAPTVNLTAPATGQSLTGNVTFSANAGDNVGVAGVQFQVNGANAGGEDTSAPYSVSWNSAALGNGNYTVTAIARDAAGNRTTSAAVAVSIANAPAPPTGVRILVEAEAASTLSSPFTKQNDSTASGGVFISTPTANSGYARFSVNLPRSGTYVVWGRVKAPSDNADSFFVQADNGTRDIYDTAEGKWSSNWQWTKVNGRGTGGPNAIPQRKFTLNAGTHTFRFDGREANSRLDRILVTDDLSYIPQ